MNYIDIGEGEPILFLHGQPDIIVPLAQYHPPPKRTGPIDRGRFGRHGKSDHPDISYLYDDHYRYVSGFIDALEIGAELAK